MIYSRFRPDRGGYDYFETSERFGLGDDIPVPRLSSSSTIGVSSVSAGRMPRSGTLIPKGSGNEARGMVMPTSRSGLEGLGFLPAMSGWATLALGVVLGFCGYELAKRWR